ncbi:MAG TPA: glycosyl hydrolase [Verrucomicrobiae bacterium]
METRRLTGPLFWLHGDESKERLEMYVGKVGEGGNGCLTTESRPHKDWLGEGWYRDLGICLEAARKHGLKVWIFDEKWWPSGEVAGKVPEQYGSKRLVATSTNVAGPAQFTASGFGGPNFIAAVAGREKDGLLDGASLVDLSDSIRDGALTWQVPPGEWKVLRFAWTPHKSGNRYLVDGASRESVDWYIRTVYQPHYDRFKEEFGKTIVGFFYDEPETHGDWGTEVMRVLEERKVDWKRALVSWKFKLAGEEQLAARYQYQQALAEAWGRTLYGGITRWCEEHKVKSIGHWLEHAGLYVNQDLCAGDMFPLQKYSSMGGIDVVFSQFKMGQRAAYDAPCWQIPKLGSSITHAYGKPDDITMVEVFGARGQDLTYPEMKWWTDHLQVSGVNFLIPHSFNPRSPRDTDCPPFFYNGGFEPRWPLYRVFADYTTRLSLVLSGGRHVCPVALLYLGGSAHLGKRVLPDDMSEALQDALYDCDWLPYEVFENDTQASGRELRLRSESYRVLVVPAAEVIPYAALAKAKEFFDAGGVVIGYGFLPAQSATLGKNSADVGALRDAIWGTAQQGLGVCKTTPKGGRSYFLPVKPTPEQLQQVLANDAGVRPTLEVLEGRTDHWLHVLHRVRAGRDVFFIVNQNHSGPARTFRFRITADGEPECWDPMRNELTSVPHQRSGKQTELTLTFEPNESVLLVFQPAKRSLPLREESDTTPRAKVIPLVREQVPIPPEPKLEVDSPFQGVFEPCSWVWYPEGDPSQAAPPGACCFRKQVALPEGRKLVKAEFLGTADNSFVLYVNGVEAGRSDDSNEGWRNPVRLGVTARLKPGANQLAVQAVNGGGSPNPAGLLGCLRVEFDRGEALVVPVDGTWKTSRDGAEGWVQAAFDDSGWKPAKEVARYGQGPWAAVGVGQLTLSPVKANPFSGMCELPSGVDPGHVAYLVMEGLSPEVAGRVTINGEDAGGLIGLPLRLPVTQHLKAGVNKIKIEPFAPESARLEITP